MQKLIFAILLINSYLYGERFNWEILNNKGKPVAVVNDAYNIIAFKNYFLVDYGNNYVVLNDKFEEIVSNDIVVSVKSQIDDDLIPFYENDKYGYINFLGKVIIDPIFDFAGDFSNGYAIVGFGDTSIPTPHSLDLVIIDINGNINNSIKSRDIHISKKNKGWGIAYLDNKYKIIKEYNNIWEIVPLEYHKYDNLLIRNKNVIYGTNGKYGFMTLDGEELTKAIFNAVYWSYDDESFFVDIGSSSNVVFDIYGNRKLTLDNAFRAIDGTNYIIIEKSGKKGLYNKVTDKLIFKPEYDTIQLFNDDLFLVEHDGIYSLVDINGVTVSSSKYDNVVLYENKFAISRLSE